MQSWLSVRVHIALLCCTCNAINLLRKCSYINTVQSVHSLPLIAIHHGILKIITHLISKALTCEWHLSPMAAINYTARRDANLTL